MRLAAICAQGVIPAFGDANANTGKIDVLAIDRAGTVTTLLSQFDTEEIDIIRQFDGGTFIPSVDPRGSNNASVANDFGGTWRTTTVSVPGKPVAVHLYDIAKDPETGNWLVVGARGPDVAFVWRSADLGATWSEDLAHEADGGGLNRFYSFRRSAGNLVVTTLFGSPAHYLLQGGAWLPRGDQLAFDRNPEPQAWVEQDELHITDRPPRKLPAPAAVWSARLDADGWVWLCDGETIWRLPPPD